MKKKILNYLVHPVGIGTWLMGSGMYADKTHFISYGNEEQEIAAIQESLELGQNHIDTAMIYGLGHTEEIVGKAIKGRVRSSIFLASKLWKSHLKGDAIQRAIEGMLARLGTAYLDLVYLHGYWAQYEPIREQLEGLAVAQDRGLIRGIGVSNFTLEQLKEAVNLCRYPIGAIQNYYSVANRNMTSLDMFIYCRSNNIAFIAAKPLERGLFLEPSWRKILDPLAKKYQKTVSQIALSWLIAQENVHVIPKALQRIHIQENIDAAGFVLDPSDYNLVTTFETV